MLQALVTVCKLIGTLRKTCMREAADNIETQSLRGFLHMVETEFCDDYCGSASRQAQRLDMTATAFESERAGKKPVVLLKKINGFKIPVITNVVANRKLLAACLNVDPRDLPTAFRERCQKYIPAIPCDTVSPAACANPDPRSSRRDAPRQCERANDTDTATSNSSIRVIK
jgi:3-polyprenyl-4-hydroxybenzoate decarboxylase